MLRLGFRTCEAVAGFALESIAALNDHINEDPADATWLKTSDANPV